MVKLGENKYPPLGHSENKPPGVLEAVLNSRTSPSSQHCASLFETVTNVFIMRLAKYSSTPAATVLYCLPSWWMPILLPLVVLWVNDHSIIFTSEKSMAKEFSVFCSFILSLTINSGTEKEFPREPTSARYFF